MLPLLVRATDTAQGWSANVVFTKQRMKLGSGDFADLRLPNELLSEIHGEIRIDAEQTSYRNLGATNAGTLGGKPLEAAGWVDWNSGETLSIGSIRITIERANPPPGFATPLPKEAVQDRLRRKGTRVHAAQAPRARGTAAVSILLRDGMPIATPSPTVPPARPAAPTFLAAATAAKAPTPAMPVVVPTAAPVSTQPPQNPATRSEPPPPMTIADSVRLSMAQKPAAALLATPSSPPPRMPASTPVHTAVPTSVPTQETPSQPGSMRLSLGDLQPLSAETRKWMSWAKAEMANPMQTFRDRWTPLQQTLAQLFAQVPASQHAHVLDSLAHYYPDLCEMPAFREVLKEYSIEPMAPAALAHVALDRLRLLAQAVGAGPLRTASELDAFIERIDGLLETYHAMFAATNRGVAAWRKEVLGDSAPPLESHPLSNVQDPTQVEAWLMDRNRSPDDAEEDLRVASGDAMVHQIALMRSMPHAARAVLGEFSPESVEREGAQSLTGFWARFGLMRERHYWRIVVKRFGELADEDGRIVTHVLPAMGRAYREAVYWGQDAVKSLPSIASQKKLGRGS